MQRHYKLRSSRLLSLLLVILCSFSLMVLWLLPLPPWLLSVCSVVMLSRTGYCLLIDAKLHMGNSCVAFRLEGGEAIVLVLRSGSHMSGRIIGCSLVTPYLVILGVKFNEQHGGRNILIMPDTMSEESFRHLRIVLRWGGNGEVVLPV